MIQFKDKVGMHGWVKIEALYPDGSTELLCEDHNTLTTSLFTTMASMLAGQVGTLTGTDLRTVQTGTAKWATYMKVGSGTTPALATDTDLESSIVSISISAVAFSSPMAGSVAMSATLPGGLVESEYNTVPLTEVGLFSESGVMLARQVYTAITKSSSFQLQYTWTITFRS